MVIYQSRRNIMTSKSNIRFQLLFVAFDFLIVTCINISFDAKKRYKTNIVSLFGILEGLFHTL